ncbi:hypothetical protein VKT23_009815 [Stygiomarasmius scandens]|uniref:Uncharacterized protein n=1 Tax=Marasmiellus scandens TaxID=2682957 RepID=A0ABR1IQR3_9AGAR
MHTVVIKDRVEYLVKVLRFQGTVYGEAYDNGPFEEGKCTFLTIGYKYCQVMIVKILGPWFPPSPRSPSTLCSNLHNWVPGMNLTVRHRDDFGELKESVICQPESEELLWSLNLQTFCHAGSSCTSSDSIYFATTHPSYTFPSVGCHLVVIMQGHEYLVQHVGPRVERSQEVHLDIDTKMDLRGIKSQSLDADSFQDEPVVEEPTPMPKTPFVLDQAEYFPAFLSSAMTSVLQIPLRAPVVSSQDSVILSRRMSAYREGLWILTAINSDSVGSQFDGQTLTMYGLQVRDWKTPNSLAWIFCDERTDALMDILHTNSFINSSEICEFAFSYESYGGVWTIRYVSGPCQAPPRCILDFPREGAEFCCRMYTKGRLQVILEQSDKDRSTSPPRRTLRRKVRIDLSREGLIGSEPPTPQFNSASPPNVPGLNNPKVGTQEIHSQESTKQQNCRQICGEESEYEMSRLQTEEDSTMLHEFAGLTTQQHDSQHSTSDDASQSNRSIDIQLNIVINRGVNRKKLWLYTGNDGKTYQKYIYHPNLNNKAAGSPLSTLNISRRSSLRSQQSLDVRENDGSLELPYMSTPPVSRAKRERADHGVPTSKPPSPLSLECDSPEWKFFVPNRSSSTEAILGSDETSEVQTDCDPNISNQSSWPRTDPSTAILAEELESFQQVNTTFAPFSPTPSYGPGTSNVVFDLEQNAQSVLEQALASLNRMQTGPKVTDSNTVPPHPYVLMPSQILPVHHPVHQRYPVQPYGALAIPDKAHTNAGAALGNYNHIYVGGTNFPVVGGSAFNPHTGTHVLIPHGNVEFEERATIREFERHSHAQNGYCQCNVQPIYQSVAPSRVGMAFHDPAIVRRGRILSSHDII